MHKRALCVHTGTRALLYNMYKEKTQKHANKEDPEETRDKESEISEESAPPRALPKTNSVLLLAVPSPAAALAYTSSSSSSPMYNGAFTHLYTHRHAMRVVHSVGPRVVPAVLTYSRVLRPSDAAHGAVCTCTVLSVYTQGTGMYS